VLAWFDSFTHAPPYDGGAATVDFPGIISLILLPNEHLNAWWWAHSVYLFRSRTVPSYTSLRSTR